MKILQKIAVFLTLAVMSINSHANVINVGGVTWDPDYVKVSLPPANDLTMKFAYDQWFVDMADAGTYDPTKAKSAFAVSAGDELQGSGRVTELNGLLDPDLAGVGLCVGCELTYSFGGLIADGVGGFLPGGFFQFGVETGGDIDGDYTLGAGVPWLTLSLDEVTFAANGAPGSVYTSGHIDVLFSAVAGPAMENFDTNTLANLLGGMSDVFYAGDAVFNQHFDAGGTQIFGVIDPLNNNVAASYAEGTADAFGDTVGIPEPSSLAILGLGLLGLAGTRFRKQS